MVLQVLGHSQRPTNMHLQKRVHKTDSVFLITEHMNWLQTPLTIFQGVPTLVLILGHCTHVSQSNINFCVSSDLLC
jgi:hypothetical protein